MRSLLNLIQSIVNIPFHIIRSILPRRRHY